MNTKPEKLTTVHGQGSVRRLQTQSTVRAPIEKVWSVLTDIEHVRHWWADGAIGKGVGEKVMLGSPEDLSGTVIVMMAPHIFEFTWHDEPGKASHPEWIDESTKGLVRFDLVELEPEATLLTLVQFGPIEGTLGASAGWHHIFESFTTYAETGAVTNTPDRFEELKKLYA